jgi:DNA-binding NarL/FixJ family response regulator
MTPEVKMQLDGKRAKRNGSTTKAAPKLRPAPASVVVVSDREPAASAALTPRERQIAILLSQGYKKREIAELLALKRGTVKHYAYGIYEKLGVFDRLELALYVNRYGL